MVANPVAAAGYGAERNETICPSAAPGKRLSKFAVCQVGVQPALTAASMT